MRLLVVHAHPVAESYNAALCEHFVAAAQKAGHEVRVRDLYALQFDPVLSRQGRLDYHEKTVNRAGIEDELEAVFWCDGLVFIYPTWWYGLPAMLKGWLDRVWVPHVTFSMPTETEKIRPLMQHIRLLGGISTYGAPWLWTRWVGDPGRRTIMRGLRSLCAPRCKTFWHAIHKMDTVSANERSSFIQKIEKRAGRIGD